MCVYFDIFAAYRENYLRYQAMNGLQFLMSGMLVTRSSEILEQRGMETTVLFSINHENIVMLTVKSKHCFI